MVMSQMKPHKGLAEMLQAFEMVIKERGKLECGDVKLVLVGQGTEALVDKGALLTELGALKNVHIFGSVSKEELRDLYADAAALVVPSKAEGFCLPVLEAKSMGVPVISRPVPAILELLSKRDIACDGFEVDSLAAAMIRFIESGRLKSSEPSCDEIEEELKRFRIDENAKVLLKIYQEALDAGEE